MQLVKGIILLGIVAYLCSVLPQLGSVSAVLVATLFLSLLVGAVNFYWYIIRATAKTLTFNPQGWITWILGRRAMTYIIVSIFAFLSSLCFVVHVPSLNSVGFWFIFLTVPVFAVVYGCFRKIFEGQSVDWMIVGRTLCCSIWITPFLMVFFYGLFLHYSGLLPVYDTLQAAIDAQPKPWEDANSALLRNAGEWSILWGACRDFGFGQLFQINEYVSIILVSAGYFALFFNVCSLLAFFFVPLREYKRLLLPLTPSLELSKIAPRHLIPLCPILIVLIPLYSALFIWQEQNEEIIPDPAPAKIVLIKIGDGLFNKDTPILIEELEKKLHDELMRELAGPLAKLDGFANTLEQFKNEREELQNRLTGLKNHTFLELKKLHEEELFPRIERNVDGYLDWYYSITGEYVRLGNLVTGNIEQHMKDKLNEHMMRNVNFQKAESIIKRFSDESGRIAAQIATIERLANQLLTHAAEVSEEAARINEKLQTKWKQEVDTIFAENEVSSPVDMSAVIIVDQYTSMDDFWEMFQSISAELSAVTERFKAYTNEMQDLLKIFTLHSREYLSFRNRMTFSSGVGIAGLGSGASIGTRIASRITRRQAFKIAVEAVAKMVGKRALGGGGGAAGGAAVGAGVGSIFPGPGTAIGAVAGGVIGGAGAWIAADYVLVKLEEHISRESFKREILYGVNEHKAEVMKALEDIFRVNQTNVRHTER